MWTVKTRQLLSSTSAESRIGQLRSWGAARRIIQKQTIAW
jgi:hypothetical protein